MIHMPRFPIFVSVILILRNQSIFAESLLLKVISQVSPLVTDYEIIVVDNGSVDDSISLYKKLTANDGISNLQIYALTKEVEVDTASWAGLENALGDLCLVINPLEDSIDFFPKMLSESMNGFDVVFASNTQKSSQSFFYKISSMIFNEFYKRLSGIHLGNDAPKYRLLSKKVISFILQHSQPALAYRHLPATAGFACVNLNYRAETQKLHHKRLAESIDRGMRLLVSTTRAPMRLVTSISLFGAIANFFYSIYIILVAFFKADISPGWASLSLQQSGMFFLISLVLLVLGEYILHMVSLSNEGPLYHVAQEFTSAHIFHREKLNIEEQSLHSK
jgi:glycosyltransferase involved in cell wall biosynthesis